MDNIQLVGGFLTGNEVDLDGDFDLGIAPAPVIEEAPVSRLDKLSKPCVILNGVSTVYEVEFLQGLEHEESVPLYVHQDGEDVQIGRTSLDLKSIIRYARLKFQATLVTPAGKEVDLLSLSGDKLLGFIKL